MALISVIRILINVQNDKSNCHSTNSGIRKLISLAEI